MCCQRNRFLAVAVDCFLFFEKIVQNQLSRIFPQVRARRNEGRARSVMFVFLTRICHFYRICVVYVRKIPKYIANFIYCPNLRFMDFIHLVHRLYVRSRHLLYVYISRRRSKPHKVHTHT